VWRPLKEELASVLLERDGIYESHDFAYILLAAKYSAK
jgi:hypothetical protein